MILQSTERARYRDKKESLMVGTSDLHIQKSCFLIDSNLDPDPIKLKVRSGSYTKGIGSATLDSALVNTS